MDNRIRPMIQTCHQTMLQFTRGTIKTMTTRTTNKRSLITRTTTKWLIVAIKASHPLTLSSNDLLVSSILVSQLTTTRCQIRHHTTIKVPIISNTTSTGMPNQTVINRISSKPQCLRRSLFILHKTNIPISNPSKVLIRTIRSTRLRDNKLIR